jgi:uncharacterized protein DUF1801
MPTKTSSIAAGYLATLPPDRRKELEPVRAMILEHLPRGYEEALAGKMLVYQVPLERYPDTYNGHALWYIALASQKNYLSLYLMSAYGDPGTLKRLKEGFAKAGKKLDMGKSCVRFRKASDLPLDVLGPLVASMSVERWVDIAKSARRR